MPDYPDTVRTLVMAALAEDIGPGDITTESLVGKDKVGRAQVVTEEACVVCGLEVASLVYMNLDPGVRFMAAVQEGDLVAKGTVIAKLTGSLASLLTGERTALNFLQRLCGIATGARRFADIAAGRATILDSRKTVPGWRWLDKMAVRTGGCRNHRMGLYDGILIKDNHIASVGSISEAVRMVRKGAVRDMMIEVEVANIEDLKEAVEAGADLVMLDNFSPGSVDKAATMARGKVMIEVSGGIDESNMADYIRSGNVDYISVGAITHSVKAIDISMDVVIDKE